MDWTAIVMLAVVQGITEFLPVSSSGHLVIGGALLSDGAKTTVLDRVELHIVLHAGTLASVLVFYWQRVWRLLGSDRRVIGLLVVGTLPAVIVGVSLKMVAPQLLVQPVVAGAMLLVTGAVLLASGRLRAGDRDYTQLSYRHALLIGITQALAILPGISRSGATIVCGMAVGLKRDAAATFSFLLAIPAISGALVLGLLGSVDETSGGAGTSWELLLLGAVVAFVIGLFALWWLLKWLHQGRLQRFAYWCFAVGTLTLVWRFVAR